MANQNDSFIDEVTDDLRRDRLFKAMRRFGWIPIVLILAVVGGAIWRENAASRAEAEARAWGDAVLAAQDAPDRVAAFSGIDAQGSAGRAMLGQMLAAGAQADAGQGAEASKRLLDAAATVSDDPILHDMAVLKAVMVAGPSMDAAERDRLLSDLSKPGAPFELLALEQKAVALIGAGRTEDAIMLIRQIQQKSGLSEPLRRRLAEMMITLGAPATQAEGPGPQTMQVAPAE
ncbi:tetratricopeptide repeat protein [Paracoccus shanxieyensis]|uniref:Tetratricopeptide repeat protein n=1 Tax=Paracoccus shanxieyensis TaxID=2675752 RepID=A0A6L6IQD2_9RHOB|nr:tetratricopeptide repeat protein [Paracoccus shanxieyensis]MTH62686.1 tetratricopeptide repeat protein [Paracoccus shanxieyensis]MTH86230.1 tetratricopeptide repeat protein [Paracoccus shanxieyensis]